MGRQRLDISNVSRLRDRKPVMSMRMQIGSGNALMSLVAAVLLTMSLMCNRGALAFFPKPPVQVGVGCMQKDPNFGEAEPIADTEAASRIRTNVEKLNRLLEQLDQKMPRRQTNGLFLVTTDMFNDLMPASKKIGDAVSFFRDVGLSPVRTRAENNKFYVGFNIPYDRLVASGRSHFRPRDVLGIRYTVGSLDDDADIESLHAVLMNDSSL